MNTLQPSEWIKRYADELLRYASFRIQDIVRCEDLVQDTFMAAWQNRAQFRGDSTEKTWLYSILKNKIADEYRSQGKRELPTDDVSIATWITDTFYDGDENENYHWKKEQAPRHWESPAIDGMIKREYLDVLRSCIARLSPVQSGILMEKYFAGSDSKSICKEFNITQSNYWTIMHRINISLRKCIELNWFKEK